MFSLPRVCPADVQDALRSLDVDPRPFADFHYVADGPESLKVGKRELAFQAAGSNRFVFECVSSFHGLLLGLIFVVESESEIRDRIGVLEVLGS